MDAGADPIADGWESDAEPVADYDEMGSWPIATSDDYAPGDGAYGVDLGRCNLAGLGFARAPGVDVPSDED